MLATFAILDISFLWFFPAPLHRQDKAGLAAHAGIRSEPLITAGFIPPSPPHPQQCLGVTLLLISRAELLFMNTRGNTGLPTASEPLRHNEPHRISRARSLQDGTTIFFLPPSPWREGICEFYEGVRPLPKTQPEQPTRQISRILWLMERCCAGLASEVLRLGDGR